MKKINVIKNSEEFNSIIKDNIFVKDNNLIIYYKDKKVDYYRFGITVPKKNGKAHLRNYYKRIIRNICDINKFCYSKEKDYIIIVRKGSLESSYQEIEESFKNLMSKIEKECNYEK